MKRRYILLTIAFILFVSVYLNRGHLKDFWYDFTREKLPEAISLGNFKETKVASAKVAFDTLALHDPEIASEEIRNKSEFELHESFNIKMQFYPQAPFANWNLPYQEACEEASVLVAMNYIRNKEVSKKEFDTELLKIIDFENEYFGDFRHTDVTQTREIIELYYNHPDVFIIDNPSVENIKKEIIKGNPVLVPLAGRLIGNPYFTSPGPIYHFLVIKGYTKTHFITHDVGTRRGEDYTYPFHNIMDNIHDWTEPITDGEKRIIIVEINKK